MTVEERYQQWIAEKQAAGATFTAEQRKWLDAIKDHIASSLAIEQDDLEEVPFNQLAAWDGRMSCSAIRSPPSWRN